MNVRPFLVATPARLEQLRTNLLADVRRWADTWFGTIPMEDVGASVTMAAQHSTYSNEVNLYRSRADTSWAIVGALPEATRQLGGCLLEPDPLPLRDPTPDALLDNVVSSALEDLVCHLLRAAADDEYHLAQSGELDALMPCDAGLPGAGILQLNIGFGECSLLVWLPLQSVSALHEDANPPLDPERAPTVPLGTAVARQWVRAEVVLGEAEVSVGALASLRVGDVISLEKSLDEPMCLRFDESPSQFAVWLGLRGRNMAVRIDGLNS